MAQSKNDTVRGDEKPMRDAGTGTGLNDSYGADTGGDATNRQGKVDGKSDSAFDNMPPECC